MADVFSTEMLTKQFASTLDILSQEKMALLPYVWDKGQARGEIAFWNQADPWDLVYNRAANAATSTVAVAPTYQRRAATPKWFSAAVTLDDIEQIKSIVDPKSTISSQAVLAAARAKDRCIWNALYADAAIGVAGAGTESFDYTNQLVGVQVGGSNADVGLNLAKLTEAIRKVEENSVSTDDEMNAMTLVISPYQKEDWLNIANLTNIDYMRTKPLTTGQLEGILGIRQVVVTNTVPYLNDANSAVYTDLSGADVGWAAGGKARDVAAAKERAVTLFARSGIAYASWGETKVRVEERADLSYVWQFFIEVKCGATRMEKGKVVCIACDEA